ncbi:MAG TPA: hypothetical protein GX506_04445 [Firmicutes bacterium]|nr:hypothetical protein [Bacillota bacterium]
MDRKILVAYASWTGSTGEVAEAIGQALHNGITQVDVLPARAVTDISPYRAVVLGTPVHAGRIHADVLAFLKVHHKALSKVPVAYFVVCLTMKDDTEANRRRATAYLNPLYRKAPQVQPVSVGLFAGALRYTQQVSFPLRLVLKAMKSMEGDYRNWDTIRAWATSIRPALLGS